MSVPATVPVAFSSLILSRFYLRPQIRSYLLEKEQTPEVGGEFSVQSVVVQRWPGPGSLDTMVSVSGSSSPMHEESRAVPVGCVGVHWGGQRRVSPAFAHSSY